jgi:hypothetical protein
MKKTRIPCSCAGGAKYCSVLDVLPYKGKDGDVELGIGTRSHVVDDKKTQTAWTWIYFSKEARKKLREALR